MGCPKYTFNLNTYEHPPRNHTTLANLQKVCIERMEVYKIISEAKKLNILPNTKMWSDYLIQQIKNNNLTTYNTLLQNVVAVGSFIARRKDHLAHWVLSLCYCTTTENRNTFIKFELYWLMLLYKQSRESELHEFLKENNLLPEEVFANEKISISKGSLNSTIRFYKTHYTQVPCLLRSRRVILDSGDAYFPNNLLIYYVMTKLETQFYQQLDWNYKMLSVIQSNDPRFYEFIKDDIPLFIPSLHQEKIPDITLENIDNFSKHHYPLCMQHIHKQLRIDHHLKYDCKMQYGIFLKCLGFPYEDALEFWKEEFTQKMSENLYKRKYEYLFKHQYGKVGSKIQYKPSTCKNILRYQPGPTQHHGCPFKHWDKEKLVQKLSDDVSSVNLRDIEDLVDKQQYEKACTQYFCAKNKVIREDVIQSPNQYCTESVEINKDLDSILESVLDEL